MRTSDYRSSPHLTIFRADTFSFLLNFLPISFSQLQFCDVISFNRHYGWYWYPGQPSLISKSLEEDLRGLHNVFLPISFSQLQFCDVISFNRHYGWYWYPGQPSLISKSLEEDLRGLHNVFSKPVLMAEYGSSAVAGRHKVIQ